jgi:MFS family permease
VFGYPAMRRLALISICFSAMQVCLSTYLVIFLIERTGSGLIAAGLVLTVTQAAGVVGRIFWGSVADLTGRPMVILSGLGFTMSLGAILLSMAGPGWPQPVLLAVLVLFGGTAIGWNGVYLAEVARLSPPGRAGEFTGGTGFLTFSGPLIGPTIFGAILWLTNSYAEGFCTAGLFTAIAGVFLARDAMAERRTARQPSDS